MTITNLPPDRPIPDADDLRLLAELINNVAIPLANAAWNARMSQAEAAARLVSMAERGLPLRLVADGDRNALWQIAQAGPVQLPPAAPSVTPVATPPVTPQTTEPAAQPISAAAPLAPAASAAALSMPPVAEVASDVPAPAATSPSFTENSADDVASGVASAAALTSSVPERPEPAEPGALLAAPDEAAPTPPAAETAAPETAASVAPFYATGPTPPAAETAAAHYAAPRWARYPVTGPAGEQLLVTVLDVRDPSDDALNAAGQPVAAGYRAVLVRSHVANVGSVYYPASADANLVLETDRHELLGRSGPLPASHPGFAIGVAPGQAADGWSLFIIPAGTTLAGLKWCIRPDIPQSIVSWPLVP